MVKPKGMNRKPSIDESLNLDQFLKISNYEDTVKQLDIYYGIVKRQLLKYQSPTNGLFPTLSTDHKIGSVRESVYCAAAIWGLYQAYRRIDDDRGKSYELGQAAVKCMRGILQCWIKQAPRVELFKKQQCSAHALHVKFHMTTGEEVYTDDEYFHLQIDVISIYLIFLVQMITSGLQIIYTQDEVAFVQNLVYYVERAYRTPDYGMWERGSKYNDGTPEIHASSIGMAKSALEAINGCNLFGDMGASWSVIYVDIDAHNRNRSIFETLLPRESSSKGIDSALLATISFPAFGTHEEILYNETKNNIIRKLKGRYGFKRFGRDGYKCVLEETDRKFYRCGQIKEFENVECEWPLFYIFMIIDGVFKSIPEQVKEYQDLLKARMQVDQHGDPVIPMYYYVPEDCLEHEKQEPHTCDRRASNEPGLYLWNQAMFVLAQLLTAGLLHINELDPIRRYLPSYNRPKKGGRYSAFQAKPTVGTATDLVVQIVLIAESMRLQAMMATYGIQTQTPHEVEPVQIWSSTQLVKVYEQLGVNYKLGLNGRPLRPIGSLGTSKIYRVCGMTVLCYPLVFEVSEFYLYRDMALLIDDIKTELQFVGRYWRLSGRPTVCLLIREEHMRDPQFKEMLDLLAMLKKGYCDGMKVRIGRLQNLISSSCVEHLDFMNALDIPDDNFTSFRQVEHDYIGYQSLTDVPKALQYIEDNSIKIEDYQNKGVPDILERITATDSIYVKCQLFGIIMKRYGPEYEFMGARIDKHLQQIYHQAGGLRYWAAVRYASSLLRHTVDSISPFITAVLVHGKQLTVGVIGQKETVFDKPMTPAEIENVIYSTIQPYDVIQAVLQQEIILYCGRLIATNAEMFRGILKIRVGWVLEAMKLYLSMFGKTTKLLEDHSPYEVRQLLFKVLSINEWSKTEQLSPLQKRKLEGCLCRVPAKFYNQVWDVLTRTPHGIRVMSYVIPRHPTLSNMTRSEIKFALNVEQMLNHIQIPEYRQLVVELLCIVSTILLRNPELMFNQQLDLDGLVKDAAHMHSKDNGVTQADEVNALLETSYLQSTSCLARAVVNNVLKGGQLQSGIENESESESCKVS